MLAPAVTRVIRRDKVPSQQEQAPAIAMDPPGLMRTTVAERLIDGRTFRTLIEEAVAAAQADRLTVYYTVADEDEAYMLVRVRDHNLRVTSDGQLGFETFLQTLPRELTFFASEGGFYVPSLCSGQCWDDCLLSVFWMAGAPAERYFAADFATVPAPFHRDEAQRQLVAVVHQGFDTSRLDRMAPITAFIEHTSARVRLPHRCAACGLLVDGRLRCGRCRVARYCDRDCQRQHWRAHRENC